MLEVILVAASPFLLNGLMAFAKWLGASVLNTGGRRLVLAFLSIMGAVAYSGLTGEPLNVDSITGLLQIALEGVMLFLASHGSYDLWKRLKKAVEGAAIVG